MEIHENLNHYVADIYSERDRQTEWEEETETERHTERNTDTERETNRDGVSVRTKAMVCLRVIFHTINEQSCTMAWISGKNIVEINMHTHVNRYIHLSQTSMWNERKRARGCSDVYFLILELG